MTSTHTLIVVVNWEVLAVGNCECVHVAVRATEVKAAQRGREQDSIPGCTMLQLLKQTRSNKVQTLLSSNMSLNSLLGFSWTYKTVRRTLQSYTSVASQLYSPQTRMSSRVAEGTGCEAKAMT